MNISRGKLNLVGLLTSFTLLCGFGGAIILNEAFPEHYFEWYPFIPVYFYLFGLGSIYAFNICRRKAPQKLLMLYLALKVAKIILSILLLLIYCVAVGVEVSAVLLTFLSFYLLYLIYDAWFFFSGERKMKKRNIK